MSDALVPNLTPEDRAALSQQLTAELWRRGILEHQRHAGQVQIREAIDAHRSRTFFLLCSRRYGKTTEAVREGIEMCRRKPGARVLILLPFANMAAEVAVDIMGAILADPNGPCPENLKPSYNSQSKEFTFKHPGGAGGVGGGPDSIMRLKGVNGEHGQFLRGTAADLIILDECGLMDDLEHVVQDVCLPMTMTTGGRIVLASTPPRTPAHDSARMYERLAGLGAAIKFTLRDAPHIPYEVKIEYLIAAGERPERCAGILDGSLEPETTTAKREYFCEFVTDAESAVIPEFDRDAEREIVRAVEHPEHFDCYVGMDPGMRDRTGILFGYLDFLNASLVVEDERLLPREHANTSGIIQSIKDAERELWGYRAPYLRVSDVDLRLQADMGKAGIRFISADKKNSIGAINQLRDLVASRRLIIHPRCKGLIRQLHNATWNNKGTDFSRPREAEKSEDGHYDLVAALKYLVRHVQWSRNPYPDGYYARGGRFGLKENEWASPKAARAAGRKPGLLDDTPLGRRLAGRRRR